jgi:cysteine synthase A
MKVFELVGGTPLVYIESLSKLTGCKIYGKAEFLNPGGSVKDRAAKGIILDAEKRGILKPGSTIVEGTAGNTGIALATLASSRGYRCIISMPDNQSREKYEILEMLGAEVRKVPPVPFANENHFYHQAKRIAAETPNAFWADQFENEANGNFHYESTGKEIWEQTKGTVDIFTCAVGTGGTISGVSRYLKEKNSKTQVIAADPSGSGIFNYVKEGKFASSGSSVTEGIGIMRLTANFKAAKVDAALQISDQEMIDVLYHVAHKDGLILGTSSGINLMSAYRLAQENSGTGKTIATILCDHGTRYSSRLLNQEWLKEKNLIPRDFTRLIA